MMPDITEPVQVDVGKPVKASDHNTSADAITEITSVLASIENGQLLNGSFEQDLSSWSAANITGGSHSISTATVIHGAKSFKATATAGGGYVDLDSTDFLNVSAEIDDVFIDGRIYPTTGVRVQAWIEWFDSSDVSISTHQFMDYTFSGGELNSWNRLRGWGRAVATARSYKVSFQLGDGTLAGDIYMDGITSRLNDPYPWIILDTPVLIYSTNLGETATKKIPVIGSAHSAYTYFTTGSSLNLTDEYMHNLDTGSWISIGSARSTTATSGVLSPFVAGLLCDDSGQLRFTRTGGGDLFWYYNMWR